MAQSPVTMCKLLDEVVTRRLMRTCHDVLCEAVHCSMLFCGLECSDESDPESCQFVLFYELVLQFAMHVLSIMLFL